MSNVNMDPNEGDSSATFPTYNAFEQQHSPAAETQEAVTCQTLSQTRPRRRTFTHHDLVDDDTPFGAYDQNELDLHVAAMQDAYAGEETLPLDPNAAGASQSDHDAYTAGLDKHPAAECAEGSASHSSGEDADMDMAEEDVEEAETRKVQPSIDKIMNALDITSFDTPSGSATKTKSVSMSRKAASKMSNAFRVTKSTKKTKRFAPKTGKLEVVKSRLRSYRNDNESLTTDLLDRLQKMDVLQQKGNNLLADLRLSDKIRSKLSDVERLPERMKAEAYLALSKEPGADLVAGLFVRMAKTQDAMMHAQGEMKEAQVGEGMENVAFPSLQ
ncbi:hypothetical protein LTR66_000642 [Elasticomyces elasticus]|nr:hypothetical protein LTR28_008040 [Elasticomyces elasticus]KAK5000527.1 hypothetical protein LTR66_000642 [Elasticomyces elasticus]